MQTIGHDTHTMCVCVIDVVCVCVRVCMYHKKDKISQHSSTAHVLGSTDSFRLFGAVPTNDAHTEVVLHKRALYSVKRALYSTKKALYSIKRGLCNIICLHTHRIPSNIYTHAETVTKERSILSKEPSILSKRLSFLSIEPSILSKELSMLSQEPSIL